MNPRTKQFLILGGIGAVVVFGVGWFLTSGSSSGSSGSSAPQNAVNPNAQDAPGGPFGAQGTMPDIGNLLSYNNPVPGVMSAPQATSVSTGIAGDYGSAPAGSGWLSGIFSVPTSAPSGAPQQQYGLT